MLLFSHAVTFDIFIPWGGGIKKHVNVIAFDQSFHFHQKSIILENSLKFWPKLVEKVEALATEFPIKNVYS